jgi:hypothetical protein
MARGERGDRKRKKIYPVKFRLVACQGNGRVGVGKEAVGWIRVTEDITVSVILWTVGA